MPYRIGSILAVLLGAAGLVVVAVAILAGRDPRLAAGLLLLGAAGGTALLPAGRGPGPVAPARLPGCCDDGGGARLPADPLAGSARWQRLVLLWRVAGGSASYDGAARADVGSGGGVGLGLDTVLKEVESLAHDGLLTDPESQAVQTELALVAEAARHDAQAAMASVEALLNKAPASRPGGGRNER